ncbi:MAG TPA: hypothetical protein VFN26_05620 [Candidatus Acidoferrum sp.]|nr:hypothetical protein [Candidatus Acidoferrum sp.]
MCRTHTHGGLAIWLVLKTSAPLRKHTSVGMANAALIVGTMAAVRCPNDALYPVSLPSSPGPGNDVTVYNAAPGLCHTRRIWLVAAWHVARAGLPYLSYRMFRDEVEAAGERN